MPNSETKPKMLQSGQLMEIVRFLVIGVVATIADAGTRLVVSYFMKDANEYLTTGISVIAGFVVGVIVNYIFSILWVFQNVKDKNAAKTQSKFWLFVLLGFIGLLFHEVLNYGCGALFNLAGISLTQGQASVLATIKDGTWAFLWSLDFWMWFLVFCVGTLIVLVWNYWSRKKWIFIAPKEGEETNE
ncbi:MAG: GtrA family protein [Bacilli bacterium]|nr:GtrA family protein [Bacilli bacterium]